MDTAARIETTAPTAFAGWCPDCDTDSAIVEIAGDGSSWATCTECESGWIVRDADGHSATLAVAPAAVVRRAAA